MNLKELLFFRARAEFDGYIHMAHTKGYTEAEVEAQRERFCSAYQIIEEAELEEEYEAWREEHTNEN